MKYLIACVACLISFPALAQEQPADSLAEPKILLPEQKSPYVYGKGGIGVTSAGISTSRIFDFATKNLLSESDKDDLLSQVGGQLRYGFIRDLEVGYYKPAYQVFDLVKPGQGFRLRNRYYNSARLGKNLLNLMFYGNKRYEDQQLGLDKSNYETWYFTSLDYLFDIIIDSTHLVNISVGVQVGHDHRSYRLHSGQLYTAPDGEYLDLELDYQLREKAGEAMALGGLGLGIGAKTAFRTSENGRLEFTVEDVGVMNWTRGRKLDTDSNFRFTGVHFDNIFDINDSLTRDTEERYTESFLYQEETNYVVPLPFYLKAGYYHKLEGNFRQWFIEADYRYLAGFYPRLAVGAELKTGYNQRLGASVSAGGFTLASLNAYYQFEVADVWTIQVQAKNINGLAVPGIFGGAIGYLSVRYEL